MLESLMAAGVFMLPWALMLGAFVKFSLWFWAGVGVDDDTQAGALEARTHRGEYISAGRYDRVTGIKLIAGSNPARQLQICANQKERYEIQRTGK